jgi:hypothetical protein
LALVLCKSGAVEDELVPMAEEPVDGMKMSAPLLRPPLVAGNPGEIAQVP